MLFHYSLVLLLLLNQVKGVQRSMSYFTVHRQYIRVNLSCTADHTHRHTLHYFCDFNDSFSVWYNSRYYIGEAYFCCQIYDFSFYGGSCEIINHFGYSTTVPIVTCQIKLHFTAMFVNVIIPYTTFIWLGSLMLIKTAFI